MDYLLGKISARGHENIRMVLSDVTAFPDVGVTREIQFNDERKLQDGEWFCIDRFSSKSYFIDYPFFHHNSVSYADVSRDDYDRIRYFIAIQEDYRIFHFQRVLTKSKIIQKKGIKYVSEHPEMIDMENVLIINSEPDATYIKDEDKLLFKDLSRIRPMFEGVEILFREATDEEVEAFLNIDMISLVGRFNKSKVSVPNRRRISNAIAQYKAFNDDERSALRKYMQDYCRDIIDENTSNVNIDSDDNLKKFIYAIDQRYYSTPINHQRRIATSVEDIRD